MRAIAGSQHIKADLSAVVLGVYFVSLAMLGWTGHPPGEARTAIHGYSLFYLATGCVLLVTSYLGDSAGAITGVGLIYLLLLVAGLVLPMSATAGPVAILADNRLHAFFATALLAVGLVACAKRSAPIANRRLQPDPRRKDKRVECDQP